MINETQEILNKLRKIEIDIEYIKETMPDREMFLTIEEKELLGKSYENEKKGLLMKSKDVRKQFGI